MVPQCDIQKGMPSYPRTPGGLDCHLFKKFGESFVYFPNSGCFFHIDETSYHFLEVLRERPHSTPEEVVVNGDSTKRTAEIVAEIETLENAGLFRPSMAEPVEIMEQQIDKRFSEPWPKLELALAETCNLACTYCYGRTSRDVETKGLMTEEVARKAIDWLFSASGSNAEVSVTLFGGEPLLNRKVFHFVMEYSQHLASVCGKHVNYSMTTNGPLLDDTAIQYIKRHNFGLMVSLDGPRVVHDKQRMFRDGCGSFELAAAGIKRLMRRRKRVTVRCTLTKGKPRLMDLIHFFSDFGFTRIALACASNPHNPTMLDCDAETYDEIERQEEEDVLPWIIGELEQERIPIYFPYGDFLRRSAQGIGLPQRSLAGRCGACRGQTTVGADGTLYPCHRFMGMSFFSVGHIESGVDVMAAKQFWRTYAPAAQGKCAGCWARRICSRPCPWHLARLEGGFRFCHDECERVLRYYERAAWLCWFMQTHLPAMYTRLVS